MVAAVEAVYGGSGRVRRGHGDDDDEEEEAAFFLSLSRKKEKESVLAGSSNVAVQSGAVLVVCNGRGERDSG